MVMGERSINNNLTSKQVFTTGEAAEICKISQQTIIRCFDNGRLSGFRVPGSRFRRIPRDDLIRFMQNNNMPTTQLEGGAHKILVVDDDPEIANLFINLFENDDRFKVQAATTGYDAGVMTEQFRPNLMILDFMLPDINGNVVCQTVRSKPHLATMKIIVVSGVIKQDEIENLIDSGADDFIKKPFEISNLMDRIEFFLHLENA